MISSITISFDVLVMTLSKKAARKIIFDIAENAIIVESAQYRRISLEKTFGDIELLFVIHLG